MLRVTQLYLKLNISKKTASLEDIILLENELLAVLNKEIDDEKDLGVILEQVLNLEQIGYYKKYRKGILYYLHAKSISFNKYKPSDELNSYFTRYGITGT